VFYLSATTTEGKIMNESYKIIRFFFEDDVENVVVATGLTREAAQAHCQNPETSSQTATGRLERAMTAALGPWFDGWTAE
jgi:hypothetical protein